MSETVNHPPHYNGSPAKCLGCERGIECIDVVEHMGFNLGNAIKYVWRADLKGDAIEDLRKAAWYIQREIEKRERVKSNDDARKKAQSPEVVAYKRAKTANRIAYQRTGSPPIAMHCGPNLLSRLNRYLTELNGSGGWLGPLASVNFGYGPVSLHEDASLGENVFLFEFRDHEPVTLISAPEVQPA